MARNQPADEEADRERQRSVRASRPSADNVEVIGAAKPPDRRMRVDI